MNFGNIRNNGLIGVLEDKSLDRNYSLHFSEWWNGEGLDLTFDEDVKISLHIDQLRLLVTALYLTPHVNFEGCKESAKEISAESERRDSMLKQIRKDRRGFTCSPTKWDE